MGLWKTLILTGFIKSTIGTSFISIGVALIFNGFVNPDIVTNFYLFGIISILMGFVIYFVGDKYKRDQEKKNVEIIQSNTENYIQAESERIKTQMKKIIEEEEEKKERAIKARFSQLEKGICTDIQDNNPNIEKYCSSKEVDYAILMYPQDFPMKSILEIGRQKAVAQGEVPDNEWMVNYVNALYVGGFINKKQTNEGLKLLGVSV
ncbi:MAG: hypothetical protein QHH15_00490 [Candidatus Thermoplasmatota archaeon]|nr:hypothetical protein [Candidatus Thermoplasmatota archaeon]MDH7506252.1 hypothetical protein [Candidatus Thermoplasmatota archaeon]